MINQRINSNGRGSTVTVNGKTYNLPPGNVSIINGTILVNGRVWNEADPVAGVVELHIIGDPLSVETDASVIVKGSVKGNVTAGGSVQCGEVSGGVSAGGSIQAAGKLGGSISAGGSVRIG